tara:strand:- start:182 stop:478 length:297 start_codon:yes stop_codon:yes gene_type:complete
MSWKDILKEQRTLMNWDKSPEHMAIPEGFVEGHVQEKINELKPKLEAMKGRMTELVNGRSVDYATLKLEQLAEIESSKDAKAFFEFYDKNLKYNLGEK